MIWHKELQGLTDKYPHHIDSVRGVGYMVGLGLLSNNLEVAAAARENGLLVVPAGHNTIRLLPALTAMPEELARSVRILDDVFAGMKV